MRHGRFITTALVAIAAMAIGPAGAMAAPSPLVDDSTADFAAGTPGTATWAVEPGFVRLVRTPVSENFPGTALPTGWAATAWPEGQSGAQVGGQGSVADGSLTVDGARFNDLSAAPTYAPTPTQPLTLEFRGTFGTSAYQHVGFGDTLATPDGPWAIFSTGPATVPGTFFARTMTGGAPIDTPIPITAVDPTQPHLYRIEWTTADVKFYVDNTLITTSTVAIAGPMRPVASDLNVGGPVVKVDWLTMGSSPSSGILESRVLEANDPNTVWGALKEVGAGTGATFETRSGNTATPPANWSNWQSLTAGAIQSPNGRYIQYRATLNAATASVDKVQIDYDVDKTPPIVGEPTVQVSGTNASASFSSADSDVARFECNLDNGAFAPCTSPKQLTGLAPGSHTFAVHAVDKVGNVGDAASKTFSIDSPVQSSSTGGATPVPSTGTSSVVTVDRTSPKVTIALRSLRASKRGTLAARVTCPATETQCKVTLQLKDGRKIVAQKTVTVSRGKTATVTLQLAKATRLKLAKRHSLKVTAVTTASDAAGNRRTTTKPMTLRAPTA